MDSNQRSALVRFLGHRTPLSFSHEAIQRTKFGRTGSFLFSFSLYSAHTYLPLKIYCLSLSHSLSHSLIFSLSLSHILFFSLYLSPRCFMEGPSWWFSLESLCKCACTPAFLPLLLRTKKDIETNEVIANGIQVRVKGALDNFDIQYFPISKCYL